MQIGKIKEAALSERAKKAVTDAATEDVSRDADAQVVATAVFDAIKLASAQAAHTKGRANDTKILADVCTHMI